jgi:hypothetical protein
MERDLNKNIPPISEKQTQSSTSLPNGKKGRRRLKESYNEKFLIKKVKTRCFKIYFRLLFKCTSSTLDKSKLKIQKKKEIFKLFKSDVCKSRNRAILYTPMRVLLSLFSNICVEGLPIKKEKNNSHEYLMNLTWEEFLYHVKRKNCELFCKEEEFVDPVVTSAEIAEFFSYINSMTKYKPRNIDMSYSNLYNLVRNDKSVFIDDEINLFIQNYKNL